MSSLTNIIFTFLVIFPSMVFSITWKNISPDHRPLKQLYQGEYVHLQWNSTELDSCRNLTISMLDAQNLVVDSFEWEREPGFTKKIWKCLSSGIYKFKVDCGRNSDISENYNMKSVENNLLFYHRTSTLFTWQNIIAPIIQMNISLFSYPENILLKSKMVSTESSDKIDNSQIEYTIEARKGYKFRAYDKCNNVIGESQEFSTDFPLEQEKPNTNGPIFPTNPTLAPTPLFTSGPTLAPPTLSPSPNPSEKSLSNNITPTMSLIILAFLNFF